MTEFNIPSNNFSSIGLTEKTGRLYRCENLESTKQWVEPESTRAEKRMEETETREEVRETRREFGSERADALSQTTSGDAQEVLSLCGGLRAA